MCVFTVLKRALFVGVINLCLENATVLWLALCASLTAQCYLLKQLEKETVLYLFFSFTINSI